MQNIFLSHIHLASVDLYMDSVYHTGCVSGVCTCFYFMRHGIGIKIFMESLSRGSHGIKKSVMTSPTSSCVCVCAVFYGKGSSGV